MGEVGIDSYRGEGGGDQKLSSNINTIAKNLRKRLMNTENVLWRYLRAKQIEGANSEDKSQLLKIEERIKQITSPTPPC
jgi:very-short-patch-repair endonuclease